jgi:hypothetical protein
VEHLECPRLFHHGEHPRQRRDRLGLHLRAQPADAVAEGRSTFESLSLIPSGTTRILDAAMLAMLYMIPYAVWVSTSFRA